MEKDKDSTGNVVVPCKDRGAYGPIHKGSEFSERKTPEPVRDTLPPPPPQTPDKK